MGKHYDICEQSRRTSTKAEGIESALARGGNDFTLILSDDGNTVTLIDHGGAEKKINVRGDSLGAMLRDVLNRAGDWIY